MSFLEELRKAAKTPSAPYTRFLQTFDRTSSERHVFYEGKDDPSIYRPQFLRYGDEASLRWYHCGRKSAVIDVYNKIDWSRFDRRRVLFLLDKDFSDFLGEILPSASNAFITRWYSIENYAVSAAMLKRVLHELMSISPTDPSAILIVGRFEQQLRRFHLLMMPITAWILWQRLQGSDPDLKKLNLNKIFDFDDQLQLHWNKGFSESSRMKYFDGACGCDSALLTARGIRKLCNVLRKQEAKTFLRGKFEMWFFVNFVNRLPGLLQAIGISLPVKLRTQFTLNNAAEVTGPRLDCPAELDDFLSHNYGGA